MNVRKPKDSGAVDGENIKPDDAKRDELLRRLLKTPPKRHKPGAIKSSRPPAF